MQASLCRTRNCPFGVRARRDARALKFAKSIILPPLAHVRCLSSFRTTSVGCWLNESCVLCVLCGCRVVAGFMLSLSLSFVRSLSLSVAHSHLQPPISKHTRAHTFWVKYDTTTQTTLLLPAPNRPRSSRAFPRARARHIHSVFPRRSQRANVSPPCVVVCVLSVHRTRGVRHLALVHILETHVHKHTRNTNQPFVRRVAYSPHKLTLPLPNTRHKQYKLLVICAPV